MAFPEKVFIHDSTPREGWQNIKTMIPTETKIELIKAIIDSGQTEINVTMLPSPKYVPQWADSEAVIAGVIDYAQERGVHLGVGKLKMERWMKMKELGLIRPKVTEALYGSTPIAISAEHAMTNFHTTPEAMFAKGQAIADQCKSEGKPFGGPIICAFGSPAHDVTHDDFKRALDFYLKNDAVSIHLADTDGLSNPANTEECLRIVDAMVDDKSILDCHLHDTAGYGLTNTYIALQHGISSFDTCIGGLGGCPFIPDARGMIATEDLTFGENNDEIYGALGYTEAEIKELYDKEVIAKS